MKISVNTGLLFNRLGIEKTFDALADAGFDCVDLNLDVLCGLDWKGLQLGNPSPFFDDPENMRKTLDEIKAAVKKTGVTIGQIHTPFPVFMRGHDLANENMLRYTKQSLDICHELNCDRAVVHPLFDGNMRGEPSSREEEWGWNIDFYSKLIPQLKEYGITCCLENMWASDGRYKMIYVTVCSEMKDACRYIDKLNEIAGQKCFGFCLDIGHLALLGIDCYQAIAELGDRLTALHIHDNSGHSDDHVMPYTGIIMWERFLKGIAESGYQNSLSFETDSGNNKVPDDFVPDLLKMVGMVGKYFDRRIAEMRK